MKWVVAQRAGTFYSRGGRWWSKCARCGVSRPIEDFVVRGDEQDSRLECRSCAQAEHQRDHPKLWDRTPEDLERSRLERGRWFDGWLTRRREARLRPGYDSIPVLDARSVHLGFGSVRRIRELEGDGRVRVVERNTAGHPAKVQLTEDKEIVPREPIKFENRCVACGGTEFLNLWRFLPSWHPAGRDVRRNTTSAALCSRCTAVIHERTRMLFEAIAGPPQVDPRARDLILKKSLLMGARSKVLRAIPLSEETIERIARSTGLEIWRLLRDGGGEGCEKELLRAAKEADRKLNELPNDADRVRRRVTESRIDLEAVFQGWVRELARETS